jgi:hypothetical protein
MARSRTLTALINDVRVRANFENSTFILDADITEWLNQELAAVVDHIILNQGQPHYRSVTTFTVAGPTTLYSLPADFYQLQEVTMNVGGLTCPVRPFMPAEHGWLVNSGSWGPFGPVRYRVQGNLIEFLPVSQSFSATVYYTPNPPRLVAPSDTFDGEAGWEMAAIFGACASAAAKEESETSYFLGERQRIYDRIDRMAANRDAGNPEQVSDVVDYASPLAGAGRWWR